MTSSIEIKRKIELLNKELKEAEKRESEVKIIPEITRLADIMHTTLCSWNHTDGCDYYYYKWTSPGGVGYGKNEYYKKAVKLYEYIKNNPELKGLSENHIETILKIAKGQI